MAKFTAYDLEVLETILEDLATNNKIKIHDSVREIALNSSTIISFELAMAYVEGSNKKGNNEEDSQLSAPRDPHKSRKYSNTFKRLSSKLKERQNSQPPSPLTVQEIISDPSETTLKNSSEEAGTLPLPPAGIELAKVSPTKSSAPIHEPADADTKTGSNSGTTEKKKKRIRDRIAEEIQFWREFSFREYLAEEARFWRDLFINSMRTENVYALLSWFTSFRLYVLRLNRLFKFHPFSVTLSDVLKNLAKAFVPIKGSLTYLNVVLLALGSDIAFIFNATLKPFLKDSFKYLGLSYILEFVADLTVVFYSTFRPAVSEEDKKLTPSELYWNRLKNVIFKDARGVRMVNALLWFAINLTCIFITGGAAAWINVAGFVIDCAVEVYKLTVAYIVNRRLAKKISALIEIKEKLLKELNASPNNDIDLEVKEKTKERLTLEIETLKQARIKVEQRGLSDMRKQIYPIIMTSLILVGMIALALFPPTTLIGFIGAGLAFTFGSVFFGLTRRLVNKWIDSFNKPSSEAAPASSDDTIKPSVEDTAPAATLSHSVSPLSEKTHTMLCRHQNVNEYIKHLSQTQPTLFHYKPTELSAPAAEVNSVETSLRASHP